MTTDLKISTFNLLAKTLNNCFVAEAVSGLKSREILSLKKTEEYCCGALAPVPVTKIKDSKKSNQMKTP